MAAPKAIRSFVAIPLSEEVRAGLGRLQAELAATGAPVRWVRPEACHLTLKFLGELPEETISAVAGGIGGLGSLASGAFELSLAGVSAFGPRTRPRVVVVGIHEATGRLGAIARDVERVAAEAGVPPEARDFSPHVTLGRVKTPKGLDLLVAEIDRLGAVPVGVSPGRELVVYRSDPGPDGARYEALFRFEIR